MVTPEAKRKAVVHLIDSHQVSQRRACDVLQVDRSSIRYQSKREDDVKLRDAIKRVARDRRRFGYRRINVMLQREGIHVNHKKLRRIYVEEKLQVRRRGGRKRALGTRRPIEVPDGPNQRWSLDFVSDAFTDGRRFRILTVVDDFTKENVALVPDTSISGLRVTRELDQAIVERGQPKTIVSDNGTEFTSMAKGLWMGGTVPLGFDANPDKSIRGLVVNKAEAKDIQAIFELYGELNNLSEVSKACTARNIRSKLRPHLEGRLRGGSLMSNGQIHHILTNPLYIGKIRHKDKIYEGQHAAIITLDLWQAVQSKLITASKRARGFPSDQSSQSWLKGKLFDETGDHLTPTYTRKDGRKIRYYISNRLIKKSPKDDPATSIVPNKPWRLPAPRLEAAITNTIISHIKTHALDHTLINTAHAKGPDIDLLEHVKQQAIQYCTALGVQPVKLQDLIDRVQITPSEITISLHPYILAMALRVDVKQINFAIATITAPFAIKRRGVEQKLIIGEYHPDPDHKLMSNLAAAHNWVTQIKAGNTIASIAKSEGKSPSFLKNRLCLAFLAPKIQAQIMSGLAPAHWSTQYFITKTIAHDWDVQKDQLFKASE